MNAKIPNNQLTNICIRDETYHNEVEYSLFSGRWRIHSSLSLKVCGHWSMRMISLSSTIGVESQLNWGLAHQSIGKQYPKFSINEIIIPNKQIQLFLIKFMHWYNR